MYLSLCAITNHQGWCGGCTFTSAFIGTSVSQMITLPHCNQQSVVVEAIIIKSGYWTSFHNVVHHLWLIIWAFV